MTFLLSRKYSIVRLKTQEIVRQKVKLRLLQDERTQDTRQKHSYNKNRQ